MATRTPPSTTKTTSDAIPSADWNKFPRGELARKTLSSRSDGTDSTETILSETVSIGTSRQIQVWGIVTVRSNWIVGGAQAALYMDGTQIQRKNIDTLLGFGVDQSWALFTSVQPSAGDRTFTLVTGVSGGAGNTVTAIANGSNGVHGTCMLLVVDVGPAYS